MKFFSFFGAADDSVGGSYCESAGRHVDVLKGDAIEEAVNSAEDRGDGVDFSAEEFDDTCVSTRHDEDGRDVVIGPSEPWWSRIL